MFQYLNPYNKSLKAAPILTFVLLTIGLLLNACVAPATQQAAKPATAAPAEKITIKLVANNWTGSQLNVNVAKLILEEKLGYTVELVDIDENAQWGALASGDVHATLEVWPSGHAADVAEYIDKQKLVENGGPLGPVGLIGWYTPGYMVEKHPELATWEGFTKPETAKLYATAETGEQGQFLAGDPSWIQYDEQVIKNLKMDFKVVVAGSEEAVLSQLDAAYSRQDPILFYFWTPHSIHASDSKYKLTRVALPEHTDACYAKADAGGIDCDYGNDVFFKAFWTGLKDAAPDAYALLKNMNYTTEDQIQMIAAVDLDKKSVAEAARAWVDANEATWSTWLPK